MDINEEQKTKEEGKTSSEPGTPGSNSNTQIQEKQTENNPKISSDDDKNFLGINNSDQDKELSNGQNKASELPASDGPFLNYLRQFKQENKNKLSGLSNIEVIPYCAERWKRMSISEKAPFVELAARANAYQMKSRRSRSRSRSRSKSQSPRRRSKRSRRGKSRRKRRGSRRKGRKGACL